MGANESDNFLNYGYRVLDMEPGSPLAKAGIQRMVDFICFEPESEKDKSFESIVKACKDKELKLQVYSLLTQERREVSVTPTYTWRGKSLLGASVRFEDYSYAHANVYFVKNVEDNSPAKKAGLLPFSDYIVGSKDAIFTQIDDIGLLAANNRDKPIHLYVHNVHTREFRDTKIVPSKAWPGEGLMGCELSMGFDYVIPMPKSKHAKKPSLMGYIAQWGMKPEPERITYQHTKVDPKTRKSMPAKMKEYHQVHNASVIDFSKDDSEVENPFSMRESTPNLDSNDISLRMEEESSKSALETETPISPNKNHKIESKRPTRPQTATSRSKKMNKFELLQYI